MSLKGYQWLNNKGEVTMSYTFKDLTLDVWQDVSEEEYSKFFNYIKDKSFNVWHGDFHNHFCMAHKEIQMMLDFYNQKEELTREEKIWKRRLEQVIEKGN